MENTSAHTENAQRRPMDLILTGKKICKEKEGRQYSINFAFCTEVICDYHREPCSSLSALPGWLQSIYWAPGRQRGRCYCHVLINTTPCCNLSTQRILRPIPSSVFSLAASRGLKLIIASKCNLKSGLEKRGQFEILTINLRTSVDGRK